MICCDTIQIFIYIYVAFNIFPYYIVWILSTSVLAFSKYFITQLQGTIINQSMSVLWKLISEQITNQGQV